METEDVIDNMGKDHGNDQKPFANSRRIYHVNVSNNNTPSPTPNQTPHHGHGHHGPTFAKLMDFENMRKLEENVHGVNLKKLKEWASAEQQVQLDQELAKQQIALNKMKKIVISNSMIIKIQSWFRMLKAHKTYRDWKAEQIAYRKKFFRAWYLYSVTEKMYRVSKFKNPFKEWASETQDSKRLSNIALTIFKKAINNSKLTPQAVMAYFNPGGWAGKITEAELNQIRRLIFKKLFGSWSFEAKHMKLNNFKAAQILRRTMKRTYGNLSDKEVMLIALHLWHRLSAFKTAERKGDVIPIFTTPYIADWAKILQKLTMKRIKKLKAAERAKILIQHRALKRWTTAMEADNAEDDEGKVAKAEAHFITRMAFRVLRAWDQLTRERGRNLRRREKCFIAWAHWAPNHRRLRTAKKILVQWTQAKTRLKFFTSWMNNIHDIIGRRTFALRVLRQHMFQPKVLCVIYTFLDKVSHLLMLDCWRRWKIYWQIRSKWKTVSWKYSHSWYLSKCGAIFRVWKEAAKSKLLRETKMSKQVSYAHLRRDASSFDFNSPLQASQIDRMSSGREDWTVDPVFWLKPKPKQDPPPTIERTTFELFEKASAGEFTYKPSQNEMLFCCRTWWHNHDSSSNNFNFSASEVMGQSMSSGVFSQIKEAAQTLKSAAELDEASLASSIKSSPALIAANVELDKILMGSATTDVKAMINMLLDGEKILPSHLENLIIFFGDKYIPLIALLLSRGIQFIAKHLLLGDFVDLVIRCNNPLTAVLVGSHFNRWNEVDITRREVTTLTSSPHRQSFVSSIFSTIVLWRVVVLLLLKKRCAQMEFECTIPAKHLTDENEQIALILKRQKLTKMWLSEASIRKTFGLEEESMETKLAMMETFKSFYVSKFKGQNNQERKPRAADPWINTQDLGSLIREYRLLTGGLADSARSVREPMMMRDEALIRRGIEKQARQDFMLLRAITELNLTQRTRDEIEKTRKIQATKARKAAAAAAALEESSLEQPSAEKVIIDNENDPTDPENANKDIFDQDRIANNSDKPSPEISRASSNTFSRMNSYEEVLADANTLNFISFNDSYQLKVDTLVETWWPEIPTENDMVLSEHTIEIQSHLQRKKPNEIVGAYLKELREKMISTQIAISKNSIGRIITYLAGLGLPSLAENHRCYYNFTPSGMKMVNGVMNVESIKDNIKFGANLIELLHDKPSRLYLMKSWWWMPRSWWHPVRIVAALEEEITLLDRIINKIKDDVKEIEQKIKEEDENYNTFNEFLKLSRKKLVSIGVKTQKETEESQSMRMAVVRMIGKEEKAQVHMSKQLMDLKLLIATCKKQFECGHYEDVLKLLEVKVSVESEGSTGSSKDLVEKLKNPAFEEITKKESEIPILEEAILVAQAAQKKHENNLKVLERQCASNFALLSRLGGEKFTNTLEIQDMAIKIGARLGELKKSETKEKKKMKILNKYCEGLYKYIQHLNKPKPNQRQSMATVSETVREKDDVRVKDTFSPQPPSDVLDSPKSTISKSPSRTSRKGKGGESVRKMVSLGRRTSSFDIAKTIQLHQIGIGTANEDLEALRLSPRRQLIMATDKEFQDQAESSFIKSLMYSKDESDTEFLTSQLNMGVQPQGPPSDDFFPGDFSFENKSTDVDDVASLKETKKPKPDATSKPRSPSRMSLGDFTQGASAADRYALGRKYSNVGEDYIDRQRSYSEDDDRPIEIDPNRVEGLKLEVNGKYWSVLEDMEAKGLRIVGKGARRSSMMKKSDSLSSNGSESASLSSKLPSEENMSMTGSDSFIFENEYERSFRKMGRTKRIYYNIKKEDKISRMVANRSKTVKKMKSIDDDEEEDDEPKIVKKPLPLGDFKGEKKDTQSTAIWTAPPNIGNLLSVSMAPNEHPDKQGYGSQPGSASGKRDNRRKAVAKVIVADPFVAVGIESSLNIQSAAQHEAQILSEENFNFFDEDDKDKLDATPEHAFFSPPKPEAVEGKGESQPEQKSSPPPSRKQEVKPKSQEAKIRKAHSPITKSFSEDMGHRHLATATLSKSNGEDEFGDLKHGSKSREDDKATPSHVYAEGKQVSIQPILDVIEGSLRLQTPPREELLQETKKLITPPPSKDAENPQVQPTEDVPTPLVAPTPTNKRVLNRPKSVNFIDDVKDSSLLDEFNPFLNTTNIAYKLLEQSILKGNGGKYEGGIRRSEKDDESSYLSDAESRKRKGFNRMDSEFTTNETWEAKATLKELQRGETNLWDDDQSLPISDDSGDLHVVQPISDIRVTSLSSTSLHYDPDEITGIPKSNNGVACFINGGWHVLPRSRSPPNPNRGLLTVTGVGTFTHSPTKSQPSTVAAELMTDSMPLHDDQTPLPNLEWKNPLFSRGGNREKEAFDVTRAEDEDFDVIAAVLNKSPDPLALLKYVKNEMDNMRNSDFEVEQGKNEQENDDYPARFPQVILDSGKDSPIIREHGGQRQEAFSPAKSDAEDRVEMAVDNINNALVNATVMNPYHEENVSGHRVPKLGISKSRAELTLSLRKSQEMMRTINKEYSKHTLSQPALLEANGHYDLTKMKGKNLEINAVNPGGNMTTSTTPTVSKTKKKQLKQFEGVTNVIENFKNQQTKGLVLLQSESAPDLSLDFTKGALQLPASKKRGKAKQKSVTVSLTELHDELNKASFGISEGHEQRAMSPLLQVASLASKILQKPSDLSRSLQDVPVTLPDYRSQKKKDKAKGHERNAVAIEDDSGSLRSVATLDEEEDENILYAAYAAAMGLPLHASDPDATDLNEDNSDHLPLKNLIVTIHKARQRSPNAHMLNPTLLYDNESPIDEYGIVDRISVHPPAPNKSSDSVISSHSRMRDDFSRDDSSNAGQSDEEEDDDDIDEKLRTMLRQDAAVEKEKMKSHREMQAYAGLNRMQLSGVSPMKFKGKGKQVSQVSVKLDAMTQGSRFPELKVKTNTRTKHQSGLRQHSLPSINR